MTQGFGAVAQLEQIDSQMRELRIKRRRVADNLASWETETDDAMTQRLRRNRTRTGMREARYRLTGDRRKLDTESLPYRAFVYVAKKWRESGAEFRGVELRLEYMALNLGCHKRHLIRVMDFLDEKCSVVVRLQELGKPTRYALSLPETETYGEAMLATFAAHNPRLRAAAANEAAHNRMERGLEALRPLADAA